MAVRDPVKKEIRRIKKNASTAKRYEENKELYSTYHQLLRLFGMDDPEFARKNREVVDRYRFSNPDAVKESARRSKAKHAEVRRAEVRQWFADNPDRRVEYEQNRRAKKRSNGGILTVGIKGKLFRLQSGKCPCCHGKFPIGKMHMDHNMPLALGGSHNDTNMQLLCQPCNQSKHAKHPIDFMQSRGFLL